MKDVKCEQRIDEALKGRLDDLRRLLGGEECEELGAFAHYALGFDYVAPGTFDDQKEGYFRYQLSWGGPSDEFRFFVNPDLSCHRVEYWFLDWFDGAHRVCEQDAVLLQLWDWLRETEIVSDGLEQRACELLAQSGVLLPAALPCAHRIQKRISEDVVAHALP